MHQLYLPTLVVVAYPTCNLAFVPWDINAPQPCRVEWPWAAMTRWDCTFLRIEINVQSETILKQCPMPMFLGHAGPRGDELHSLGAAKGVTVRVQRKVFLFLV